MKSPYFNPEHHALRREVRELFAREVLPHAAAWEKARRIPKGIWQVLAGRGLLGLHQARAVGGGARDFFHSVVFLEELGRAGYGGFRAATAVHAYMAADYLARHAGEHLGKAYLAPAIRGERLAALAMTEPSAGSDLGGIATVGEQSSDELVVTGRKAFVTSGFSADFFVVLLRTELRTNSRSGATGLSVVVIDAHADGIQREEVQKIGWHCSETAHLRFEGVRVPRSNVIGELGRGFQYVMQSLQLERLVAAIVALGEAEACLELTRDHVSRRELYGSPLAALQAIRHRLADLFTEVAAARQLVYHAAWLYDQGELPVLECSMAKLKSTEVVHRVADECLQFHGGYGYLDGSAIARLYCDTRIATIVGGASEVMRDIIAQAAVDGVELDSIRSGRDRWRDGEGRSDA